MWGTLKLLSWCAALVLLVLGFAALNALLPKVQP